MHPSSERDNKIYHVAVPEMPTSGDLKSGDCLFSLPPGISTTPPPKKKIDPVPNGNDLGHYMTSYMMYILSKFEIIKSQTESALLFTKYSIFIVDVKAGDLCTKAGERETRQKGVSLPPKAGELAMTAVPILKSTIKFCHFTLQLGRHGKEIYKKA